MENQLFWVRPHLLHESHAALYCFVALLLWQKQCCEDELTSHPGSTEPLEDYTKFNLPSSTDKANKVTTEFLSLVSHLPYFFIYRLHSGTQKQKSSEKLWRPGSIHHMNDVKWTRRWGGAQAQKATHWTISLSALPQFWTPDVSIVGTTCLGLVCAYLNITPSPPIFTLCTLVMNSPRLSPFFCHSSASVYYCERKWKV